MSKMIAGADSLSVVTSSLLQSAGAVLGDIQFWGRYFTSTTSSPYSPSKENKLLHDRGIRVLPLGRQTNHVNGTESTGFTDGQNNAQAVLQAFGASYLESQGGAFYLFLDVENKPTLSAEYWRGWTRGIAAATEGTNVTFLPALYTNQCSPDTWNGLSAAMAGGAPCEALYVAHWMQSAPKPFPPPPWKASYVTPTTPIPCPVVIWQYQNGSTYDCDELSPDLVPTDFLSHLILPPGEAVVSPGPPVVSPGAPVVGPGAPETIPPRPAGALTGSQFAAEVQSMGYSQSKRDQRVLYELSIGNIPDFYRRLNAVQITNWIHGVLHTVTYHVMPDYLAIGSNDDYLRMPMSPLTAQAFGDRFGFTLPTPMMVDQIHAAAGVKLEPKSIAPCTQDFRLFVQHNGMIQEQLAAQAPAPLVDGDKKDVVTSVSIAKHPGKVVIYGWHYPTSGMVQPLFPTASSAANKGHDLSYMDYSHGLRMVSKTVEVDGRAMDLHALLVDPELWPLVSDEGPVPSPRYAGTPTIPIGPHGEPLPTVSTPVLTTPVVTTPVVTTPVVTTPVVTTPVVTTPVSPAASSVAQHEMSAWHSARLQLEEGRRQHGTGTWETDGKNNGPLVNQYQDSVGCGHGQPWCGCFVGFNYLQAGFDGKSQIPATWTFDGHAEPRKTIFLSAARLRLYAESAGCPREVFPTTGLTTREACKKWLDGMLLRFVPQPGDVVLMHTADGPYKHVGMVASYDPASHEMVLYEGNMGDRAGVFCYDLQDPSSAGLYHINMILRFRDVELCKTPAVPPSGPSPEPPIG